MTRYRVEMEIPEGKIDEIMTRLENAQEEIYKCYDELQNMGVLKVVRDNEEKEILEKLSWGMQHEEGSQNIDVFPMNGEKIVIHGKQEADSFCKMLMECFR